MTTIYVGNLPFTATEDEVRAIFEHHGKVESVKLINDRETGRPRGFAFVDMAAGEAQNAIQQSNGFQMGGRPPACSRSAWRPGALMNSKWRPAQRLLLIDRNSRGPMLASTRIGGCCNE